MARTAVVRVIKLEVLGFASALHAGDLLEFAPVTEAFAVQRELPDFLGNEGRLEAFGIFSQTIPQPAVDEPVEIETVNRGPAIRVDRVRVISVSTSSLLQVGSLRRIALETRTKHIRQFVREQPGLF